MSNVTPQGLHTIATLIKRLEAAASRFEDIAETVVTRGSSQGDGRRGSTASGVAPAAVAPAAPPAPSGGAAAGENLNPLEVEFVAAFQRDILEAKLKPFVELTKSFAGPNVIELANLVEKEYALLFGYLKIVALCQRPTSDEASQSLLKDFPPAIEALSRAKETMRRDRDWFAHLTFICEGAPAIGWVVNPKPVQFLAENILDTLMYYGNKIKKEFKEKDAKHVEWVILYVGMIETMKEYVKQHHPMGPSWNVKGVTVDQYKASGSSASAPSAGGAPPPPPPPPPAPHVAGVPAPTSGGGAAAVFAELNRGEDVTKGLRKVDKSEMTHKNPALRTSSVVPASPSPSGGKLSGKKPIKPSKPQALAGKKPSKFALEINKWMIEYHEGDTLTLDDVSLSQSVNIYGCKGTIILIKGKVNAVNIINSQKTSVLLSSVVASVSITNSPSFQLQITGTAPMIQIDSTDSGQVYLSKESLTAEITTAKCSAINISLPVPGEEEGIFEEQPVPEMFKTTVQGGKLVTTIVEHSG
ncbi:adenylate cyclase associated N terminal-domain-containing protein [Crepidotus variabilis]|uniref:Adenylyl cyclase-associated protein n=1 Tax=Crepidotus variabilis TaxID=179855 RepID=A0A9P6EPB4_9AGAR|nr:adenylate cyclase associated N terminal-domain-containing protein [Crepidotus variabilis]